MRRSALALLLAAASAAPAAAQTLADRPVTLAHDEAPPVDRPKNLVLFIADGFGPASATLGRAAKGRPLAFDSVLVGSVETSATDSRVTDSAAGATAYACGIKTYNGAIGVDAEGRPCRTLLEAAEARGMATGLVATSRITHATPASFAAHVAQRSEEAEIARQMAASGVDLLLGGGASFFENGPWGDLDGAGYALARTRAEYDALGRLPAAALLAPSHLAYEVDRDETDQPSLADMTTRALRLLAASADGEANGFFVMIEGSRIDHAGHANDPAAHAHDILAYDAAVAAALEWAARDGNTLVVATADHETGGLSLGRDGVYEWDPAPLLAATASVERVAERLGQGGDPVETVREALGVDSLSAETAEAVRGAAASQDAAAVSLLVRTLASESARVGWTTGGHTAVDVGLYAWGPGAERFVGAMPNAAVGRALFGVLGFEPGRGD